MAKVQYLWLIIKIFCIDITPCLPKESVTIAGVHAVHAPAAKHWWMLKSYWSKGSHSFRFMWPSYVCYIYTYSHFIAVSVTSRPVTRVIMAFKNNFILYTLLPLVLDSLALNLIFKIININASRSNHWDTEYEDIYSLMLRSSLLFPV